MNVVYYVMGMVKITDGRIDVVSVQESVQAATPDAAQDQVLARYERSIKAKLPQASVAWHATEQCPIVRVAVGGS